MSQVEVAFSIVGQGPAIYMIHGIGARKATWNGIIPALSDRFTCVTFDLRGHGESPAPPTPYSLDDLVTDVAALREKLNDDKIHVVGHSLGGMIGPAFAKKYPQNVSSLTLLSTAAGRTPEDRDKLAAVRRAMTEEGINTVLDRFLQRWYTDEFIATHPEVIAARKQQVLDTPTDVFLNVFDIYAQTEMGPWLHELQCPSLVLTGELDGGCSPRLNEFIAEEIPNSELLVLDNLKHSILVEAPDRVAAPVRDFLLRQH